MDIDIVLHHKATDKYILLELKYKTVSKDSPKYYPLGGTTDVALLSNQVNYNQTYHQYWRDVYRIEFLKKHFTNVEGGIALFLTNNTIYQNQPKDNSGWAAFTMHQGAEVGPGKLKWKASAEGMSDKYPSLDLEYTYKVDWQKITMQNIPFYYCMTLI
ncbi:MAG: hypothetical protein ACI3Z5_00960 [Paludibacteraceae bacterium]